MTKHGQLKLVIITKKVKSEFDGRKISYLYSRFISFYFDSSELYNVVDEFDQILEDDFGIINLYAHITTFNMTFVLV